MPQSDNLLVNNQIKWDFSTITNWVLANQNDMIDNSSIEHNGECTNERALKIYTEANSRQWKKLRTEKKYGAGLYTWRTYISDLAEMERVSIGSWLYNDDKHEIDFEIGSGNSKDREELKLNSNEVIAYITSQDNPWVQKKVKLKKNKWYVFQIDLKLVNKQYFATWIIDGTPYAKQQLSYGEEYLFYIFCSVENLEFIGDAWPHKDNYGLWDYVSYTPYSFYKT